MHRTTGVRDPAAGFALPTVADDADERRQANRALHVSAVGLAVTGAAELLIAVLTGSDCSATRFTTCPTCPPAS